MRDYRGHLRTWWESLIVFEQAGALVLRGSGNAGFLRFLLVSITGLYAVYGFSMGLFAGIYPALVSMLKLPALFLCTVAVVIPSFHVLNLLLGCRFTFPQSLRLVLLAISANAIALASYAPVSYLFVLSAHESTYFFLVVMHVAVFTISGLISLGVIVMISRAVAEATGKVFNPGILLAWGLLYGLVGSQMSWILRPWIGSPTEAYALFRPIESSFPEFLMRLILQVV